MDQSSRLRIFSLGKWLDLENLEMFIYVAIKQLTGYLPWRKYWSQPFCNTKWWSNSSMSWKYNIDWIILILSSFMHIFQMNTISSYWWNMPQRALWWKDSKVVSNMLQMYFSRVYKQSSTLIWVISSIETSNHKISSYFLT